MQSYLDTLDFGLVSCRELVPDLWDLADLCVEEVTTWSPLPTTRLFVSATYEKAGFVHDDWVMQTYGARYARCDVAMLHRSQP